MKEERRQTESRQTELESIKIEEEEIKAHCNPNNPTINN
jgi:hypothetical protein